MGGNPWETLCEYINRAGQRLGHQICYLIMTRLCLPCKYPWCSSPTHPRALCTCACFNDCIRGVVHMESCYINLLFLYRFEAIFNWHFNATYTIDMELMWHHMSELQANFKVPTYEVVSGTLTPVDKESMEKSP